MAITSIQPCLPSSPAAVSDGDGISRSKWLEREWVALDGMGAVRNGFAAGVCFGGQSVPTAIIGAIPILQCLGGAMIVHTAIQETVPKSWQAWRKAIHCQEKEGLTEGKIATGLGFANQLLYLAMGSDLLASGITGFLGPEAAHAFGYSAVIGSNLPNVLSNFALGGICIARGAVILGRSLYNLSYIRDFEKGFLGCFTADTDKERIANAKSHLQTELAKGEERFIRRVGGEVTARLKEMLCERNGTDEEWKDLLHQVDRGIFKQKLMQYLTILIGIFMILGGIASVVFAGGALATTIGMGASCCLFAGMESLWFTYDSSWLFNKIADQFYTPSKLWIEESAEEPQMISNQVA